jgi:hypothetical protein
VKRVFVTSLWIFPLLAACATDPYTGRPDAGARTMGGALIGAAVGALGGGAAGISPVAGAAAGMVAGGAVGYATSVGGGQPRRHYYRDTRGYCYYVDASGQPQYDYTVKC